MGIFCRPREYISLTRSIYVNSKKIADISFERDLKIRLKTYKNPAISIIFSTLFSPRVSVRVRAGNLGNPCAKL